MLLDKAIEIGELNVKQAGRKMPPDTLEALKILLEAGKRIRRQRLLTIPINQPQLPGETF